MASKTNFSTGSRNYYRIRRKVGMKLNKEGAWVPEVKAFYGSGKLDAERKYQEYMASKAAGINNEVYFGPEADKYMEEIFPDDPRLKDGTKLRYVGVYNSHIRPSGLAGKKLADLKPADLQVFYNSLECPASTVHQVHKVMRKLFSYFEANELCRDLTQHLYLPADRSAGRGDKTPVWSNEELTAIFSEALDQHRLKLLFVLAYGTGARIGELLALTYDDISDGVMTINKQVAHGYDDGKPADVIQPPKTENAYRDIPLTDQVIEAVREHESWHRAEMAEKGYRTSYIFTTSTGELYDRSNLRRAFQRYYKKVGVPYKEFRSFRKTFCSELCAAGAPLQVVYRIMGHSSIDVTAQFYVDVDLEQKREALSLMK